MDIMRMGSATSVGRWLAVVAVAAGWGLAAQAQPAKPAPADAPVSCLLEPSRTVAAASPVAGVVARVGFERGDRVRAGDVLFELESSVERATLQMATARRDLVFAKWERHQALIRDGVLTPQEADELRQERALAEAAHAEAQAVLQRRTVRSPIDAHVVERLASPGEYVRDNVVLKLAELDPLHAELTWPAESRPRLRVGQTMRLQAGGAVLQGQVRIVDPLNDAASGTFGVRVVVPNPGLRVAAGQMCRVLP